MNALSQTDFALKSIAVGRTNLATDPRTGVFQIYTGELLLAHEALAASVAEFYEALRRAANTVLAAFSDFNIVPAPQRQNDCIIFAAAADDLRCASELAAIEPDYSDSHRFDIKLNRALRALLLRTPLPSTDYRPTTSEAGLFDALSSVGTHSFSTSGTDSYWRATRRKRYRLTIYEHRNLFSEALQKLHEVALCAVLGGGKTGGN